MKYIVYDTCNGKIEKVEEKEIKKWIAHFICDFQKYYYRVIYKPTEKTMFLFMQMACHFIGFPYFELTGNDRNIIIENNNQLFNSLMGDIWEANISDGRW